VTHEWEPGDPLPGRHRNSSYQGFLFNFREIENNEECFCPDRASWPDPAFSSHALKDEEWFMNRFKEDFYNNG